MVAQAAFALLILVGGATAARSAELVMFEQPFCEWCENWKADVGIIYAKTHVGRRLPIRNIDIHRKRPADLSNIKPVIFTPTFVLMQDGTEIGRILGYSGEDQFWGLLDRLVEGLPPGG